MKSFVVVNVYICFLPAIICQLKKTLAFVIAVISKHIIYHNPQACSFRVRKNS